MGGDTIMGTDRTFGDAAFASGPLSSGTGHLGADDRAYFVSPLAADPDFVEIVDAFVASLPSRLTRIERALGDGASTEFATLVHQLKGASGSHGFDDLYRLLCRLESAHGENDVEAIERAMRDVRFVVERTVVVRPKGAEGGEAEGTTEGT